MKPILRPLLLAGCGCTPLAAQSFLDVSEPRNAPAPFASVLQLEAGAIGTLAKEPDLTAGLDDDISWDAKVWYRNEQFSSRRGTLEAYAGRDGLFASYSDGKLISDDTITRFEFRARPWMFYRDGFYRDGELVKNGFYDGSDYEGYIGFGREAQESIYIEFGPYYKQLDFARSDLTPATFQTPEGYAAYGGRVYLEQSAVQMDRRRGTPREGWTLTVAGEREWNDAEGEIGSDGFSTTLPSAVWRARGRIEWYIPGSDTAIWEVFGYGGWQDEKDRVYNYEGQKPLGNIWADAQLRLRLHLGTSITLVPFVHAQYSRLLEEDGYSTDREFFLGGGAEAWLHFSDTLSLHTWYSYLDNENRPSILIDEDLHGEHMFYAGMVLRFGSSRR